jgi:very-short-patch-repair endonuclease
MKSRPPIHNLKHLESNRKTLRKKLTPAEAYLWHELKGQKLSGLKFRRQHSVVNYILDFYCSKHKLAIELDGNYHDEPNQLELDTIRDKELERMGITVLRYENKYVFEELQHVLGDIKKHCRIE